jgi:hypothetical protein
MTTLADFCARTGLDTAAVRQALSARAPHDDSPWYMQTVLGIGAWITSIAALAFAWVVMDLVFGIDEPNLAVALIGALVFAASLWLLQHRPQGAFSAHAAVALATAASLLVAAGVGVPVESAWAAALATLPCAAAAIWQQRSQLLQFLIVSVAVLLVMLAVWDYSYRLVADVPAVFMPLGAALLLYPPRRDLRPTAFALLIVPQLFASFEPGWTLWHGWPAKGLFLALFAFLFAINWRRMADAQTRLLAAAGAAAAAVVAFLLPTGASAALVLLALAYTLGSRPLAIIGALAAIYFIWRFYWDLQETLLTKSIILMSAGAILLICYALLIGTMRERRAS